MTEAYLEITVSIFGQHWFLAFRIIARWETRCKKNIDSQQFLAGQGDTLHPFTPPPSPVHALLASRNPLPRGAISVGKRSDCHCASRPMSAAERKFLSAPLASRRHNKAGERGPRCHFLAFWLLRGQVLKTIQPTPPPPPPPPRHFFTRINKHRACTALLVGTGENLEMIGQRTKEQMQLWPTKKHCPFLYC